MPRGDGTGPIPDSKKRAGGSKSWETLPGSGPGGTCVCNCCGKALPHRRGVPCNTIICPECGSVMTREDRQTK